MTKTTRSLYATTYHRDGSVTVWDVHAQSWSRTTSPSDALLASLGTDERRRVILHTAGAQWRSLVQHAERIGVPVSSDLSRITLRRVDGEERVELALVREENEDGEVSREVRLYEPGQSTAYGDDRLLSHDGTRTLSRRSPSYY